MITGFEELKLTVTRLQQTAIEMEKENMGKRPVIQKLSVKFTFNSVIQCTSHLIFIVYL